MITIAPISPIARANAIATPERMPGRMLGSTMRREDGAFVRAQRTGSLLHLRVELVQDWLNRAHDERQRHEEQHEVDRIPRECGWTPTGECGP